MNTVVKADAEFVIWLIVGLFWVVAQIAGSKGKKKAPPRPPSKEGKGGEAPVDPFAELMRKLSGVQEFKIPTPPEPEPLERAEPLLRKGEMHLAPTPSPKPAPALPPVVEPVAKIAEVDIRPTMSAFRNTLPAMRLPAMRLHFQCAPHHDRDVDSGKDIGRADYLELHGRKNLRRAMLNHIIFSKPKALEGTK